MPASTPSVSRSLYATTIKYPASVDPPRQRVIGFRALSKGIGRARRLVLNAAAKVNLILEVLGKRDDGYHELVTVMQAVDLSDRVTREDSADLELTSSPGVPADGRNLALRAATALREAAGVTRGARITLDKRIPVAAGLGGGSTDAAAVLLGLNRLWRLRWPVARLDEVATGLGMDVPFFLRGGTALGTGGGGGVGGLGGGWWGVGVGNRGLARRAVKWRWAAVPSRCLRRGER